jgi:hypothetical protein
MMTTILHTMTRGGVGTSRLSRRSYDLTRRRSRTVRETTRQARVGREELWTTRKKRNPPGKDLLPAEKKIGPGVKQPLRVQRPPEEAAHGQGG